MNTLFHLKFFQVFGFLKILYIFFKTRTSLYKGAYKKSYLSHRIIDSFLRILKRKIVCNTILYIIFQYYCKPVRTQRIFIGLEAIHVKTYTSDAPLAFKARKKLGKKRLKLSQ